MSRYGISLVFNPDGFLRISTIPFWFRTIEEISTWWPFRYWYQEIMNWYWNKIDTYPYVDVPILAEQINEVRKRLWDLEEDV